MNLQTEEYIDIDNVPNPYSYLDWIPQNKILAIPPKKALDITGYLKEGRGVDSAGQTVRAFIKRTGRLELKAMVREGRLYVCNMGVPHKNGDN